MASLVQPILRFLSVRLPGRKGQTLVEYSLILAIITIVLVSVFALLSKQIVVIFSAITVILDTAQAGSH